MRPTSSGTPGHISAASIAAVVRAIVPGSRSVTDASPGSKEMIVISNSLESDDFDRVVGT
jgi:hypothetical protein